MEASCRHERRCSRHRLMRLSNAASAIDRRCARGRPSLAKMLVNGQPAARTSAAGNGPSARSVNTESQYSLTSLILPASNRNTRQ
jgi:hypothetical protein